jgi:LPPG:FO 2-phospho-L-lactate transferase
VSAIERCVILAGGTGGAKLAVGLQDVLGAGVSVIANAADDIEIAGVDVSPDPDLITYWLSGEIDEDRGWGIKGDTFTVFDRLIRLGTPDWFRLSDRDLATCLYRKAFIEEGGRRTDAQAQIARALGVRAAVLPMTEQRVRTRVRTADGWRGLQQYLVAEQAHAQVEEIEIEGIGDAHPTPEVLDAIAGADAIVVGPSNPVISIGPIVSMPELREAVAAASAPVVAVSPYVAGQVVKGPTDIFMAAVGRPSTAAGVASLYEGLIDGMVCDPEDLDPPPENVPVLSYPTLMEGAEGRFRLAARTLDFSLRLRSQA